MRRRRNWDTTTNGSHASGATLPRLGVGVKTPDHVTGVPSSARQPSIGTAEGLDIVTVNTVSEVGPAFLVYDSKAYNQSVAAPALDGVVDGLIEFPAN